VFVLPTFACFVVQQPRVPVQLPHVLEPSPNEARLAAQYEIHSMCCCSALCHFFAVLLLTGSTRTPQVVIIFAKLLFQLPVFCQTFNADTSVWEYSMEPYCDTDTTVSWESKVIAARSVRCGCACIEFGCAGRRVESSHYAVVT